MVFRSAGFLDAGRSCPPELVAVLAERNIDATGHQSYRLDEASVAAAELLLTMEGSHVQQATMIAPEAYTKIVPLREAAAILEQGPGRGRAVEDLLEELNRERDPRQYLGTRWDVSDPYGRRVKAYRQAVEEIEELVSTIIGRLH